MQQTKYITKSTIVRRGWSESMVKALLGAPDKEAPNPYYRTGSTMKLYAEERVLQTERTESFQTAKAKVEQHSERRKAGAKKAVATKEAKTAELIRQAVITVKVVEREEVIRLAREHQRNRQAYRAFRRAMNGDFGEDWSNDDSYTPSVEERAQAEEEFVARITVNYIRHQLTEYDSHCDRLVGMVGREEAYRLLRRRVFAAIRETYPWLSTECST